MVNGLQTASWLDQAACVGQRGGWRYGLRLLELPCRRAIIPVSGTRLAPYRIVVGTILPAGQGGQFFRAESPV